MQCFLSVPAPASRVPTVVLRTSDEKDPITSESGMKKPRAREAK